MIPNAAEPITVFDMHKMWQSSVKFHINKFVFLNVVFFFCNRLEQTTFFLSFQSYALNTVYLINMVFSYFDVIINKQLLRINYFIITTTFRLKKKEKKTKKR